MKITLPLLIVKKAVYRIAGRNSPRSWGCRGREGPIGGSLELLRPIQKHSPLLAWWIVIPCQLGWAGRVKVPEQVDGLEAP